MSSWRLLLLRDLVGDLLAALVAGLARPRAELVERLRSSVDDVAQLLGDVVVDTAEVVLLELVAAPAAQLLEQLAQALHSLAVAVAEAGLHQPPQRGVEVAVVQQVVGDLAEDRVGVELEADLRAVPARVSELRHAMRHCRQKDMIGGYPVASAPVMPLPEGFLWGTGASSTQCEGAAPRPTGHAGSGSAGHRPRATGTGSAAATPRTSSSLAEHGLTHHRLSLEWARLEPDEGKHDHDAIEHYRSVLQRRSRRRHRLWVCLHHFTLPGWFSDDVAGSSTKAASY